MDIVRSHRDLNENGVTCCRETVRNVLAEQGLRSNIRRKHRYPKAATHEPVAENVLSRVFYGKRPESKVGWRYNIYPNG